MPSRRVLSVVFAFLTACEATGDPPAVDSHTPALLNAELYRGHEAIGLLSSGTTADEIGCTATLIAPNVLLTAAHCLFNAHTHKPASVAQWFAPGSGDSHDKARRELVHTGYPHPLYVRRTEIPADQVYNDIAVVFLANPIDGVEPLPRLSSDIPTDKEAVLVGFGCTALHTRGDGKRRSGKIAVEKREGDALRLAKDDKYARLCQADSGGPLLWKEGQDGAESIAGVHMGWIKDPQYAPDSARIDISTNQHVYDRWITEKLDHPPEIVRPSFSGVEIARNNQGSHSLTARFSAQTVKTIRLDIDGVKGNELTVGPTLPWRADNTLLFDITNLRAGEHTIKVWALADRGGRASEELTLTVE